MNLTSFFDNPWRRCIWSLLLFFIFIRSWLHARCLPRCSCALIGGQRAKSLREIDEVRGLDNRFNLQVKAIPGLWSKRFFWRRKECNIVIFIETFRIKLERIFPLACEERKELIHAMLYVSSLRKKQNIPNKSHEWCQACRLTGTRHIRCYRSRSSAHEAIGALTPRRIQGQP
jgi:hypothetical protein